MVSLSRASELLEHLNHGWLNELTTELSVEVLVALEHAHGYAIRGQQVREHHARRPRSDDDDGLGRGHQRGLREYRSFRPPLAQRACIALAVANC